MSVCLGVLCYLMFGLLLIYLLMMSNIDDWFGFDICVGFDCYVT